MPPALISPAKNLHYAIFRASIIHDTDQKEGELTRIYILDHGTRISPPLPVVAD